MKTIDFKHYLLLSSLLFLAYLPFASAGSVGGTLTGVASNTYLTLKNNNTDTLILISSSTNFKLPKAIAKGKKYAVTITKQPINPVSNSQPR